MESLEIFGLWKLSILQLSRRLVKALASKMQRLTSLTSNCTCPDRVHVCRQHRLHTDLCFSHTFWRIVRNRSTEDFDVLPYITALLSSSLWTYYGLTRPGRLLIATVDGVGILLESTYVILFLVFASPERRARAGKLVALMNVGVFGGILLVTQLAMRGSTRWDVIGFFCVCMCSFSYTSPLAIMKLVIQTKSVEYMPFLLSFFIFINGVVWTTYAVLVGDLFIGLPSGIGFVLGSAQLVLYCIYWKPRKPQHMDAQGNLDGRHKTFWRIVRNRSTEDFDVLPYITALLSSSLWTYYGLTRPGRLLIATVDGVGILLESTYVILFLVFASPERRLPSGIGFVLGSAQLVLYCIYWKPRKPQHMDAQGNLDGRQCLLDCTGVDQNGLKTQRGF
ncbi:hypothetical protein Taro_009738 [Colocasia esculenta]|uniref:Bidirectional sugar transporter SWEET n=1 Tax=Colocasia esculenta TaxID=4460 RepID=A0A843U118_COLES|nr:hypothetical protein [Colocasia esculenta]